MNHFPRVTSDSLGPVREYSQWSQLKVNKFVKIFVFLSLKLLQVLLNELVM